MVDISILVPVWLALVHADQHGAGIYKGVYGQINDGGKKANPRSVR
jgi:hypothetical protein